MRGCLRHRLLVAHPVSKTGVAQRRHRLARSVSRHAILQVVETAGRGKPHALASALVVPGQPALAERARVLLLLQH